MQAGEDVNGIKGQYKIGEYADRALEIAHLRTYLDQAASPWHSRVPQLLDGVALLQNQNDLDHIDDALKGAHKVDQSSAKSIRTL